MIHYTLQRVAESTDAHNKLQSNLSKTMQEIYDQEKHIAQLKKSIRDKEAPLKVLFRILTSPSHLAYRIKLIDSLKNRRSLY